jgi:acetoacetate decarboxylase
MFKFSEESNYIMPAHFGGWPGRPQAATYHDVTSIAVSYETDPGMLTAFIPEPFEMTESALSIQYSMCRRVDWMGGGGYNLIKTRHPSSCRHVV